MPRTFTYPVADSVRTALKLSRGARDHFWIGSSAEFMGAVAALPRTIKHVKHCRADNEWCGAIDFADAVKLGSTGDLSAVAATEPMLDALEAMFPAPTARRRMVDDVAGGFPNVPAFIAGTPLTMRRRAKQESEFAPLAIVVNLMSSAMVDVEDVRKRGVAVLALVRALAGRRPVELYVGLTCAGRKAETMQEKAEDSANIYFQIDTAPLDLARAAFFLTNPAVLRSFTFAMAVNLYGTDDSIPWAWGRYSNNRDHYSNSVARAFPHVSDVLAIPGLAGGDTFRDPLAWVAEHVRQFGDADLDAAA